VKKNGNLAETEDGEVKLRSCLKENRGVVRARQMYASDKWAPEGVVKECASILVAHDVGPALRVGDVMAS
jgi:hypothetical protein